MRPPLDRPIVCLITNGDASPENFSRKKKEIIDTVRRAAESSVSIVQIREKRLTVRQLYELTCEAVSATAGSRTLVVVNERADVAIAAGAGGVHLRSDSISPETVRLVAPTDLIIGVSTHTLDEVLRAARDGADYALFGPVFETPGKPDATGIDELRRICEIAHPFPVLALGGIDAANAGKVIDAGAAGFASIRFMNSEMELQLARNLRDAK